MGLWTRINKDGEREVVTEEDLKVDERFFVDGERAMWHGDGYSFLDVPYVLFDDDKERQAFITRASGRFVMTLFSHGAKNVLVEEGFKEQLRTIRVNTGRAFYHHSVRGAEWPTWKTMHKKRYHWYR